MKCKTSKCIHFVLIKINKNYNMTSIIEFNNISMILIQNIFFKCLKIFLTNFYKYFKNVLKIFQRY